MDDLIKVLAGLASLFALYKILAEVVLAKSSKRREEYSFSKQFIEDLNNANIHRFVLEKGFFALVGKLLSVNEIKLLLTYQEPNLAIERRTNAQDFIDFDSDNNEYKWRGWFSNIYIRIASRYGFLLLYVIIGFVALAPYIFPDISLFGGIVKHLISISIVIVSITCLAKHENFREAKVFMEMK